MKKNVLTVIATTALVGSIIAYQYVKQAPPKPEPVRIQEEAPPVDLPVPPEPEKRQVLDTPAEPAELPHLDASDSFMLKALAGLLDNQSLMSIFHSEELIRSFVVTIDNLPGDRAPMRVMPIQPARGKFLVSESEQGTIISPKNKARYELYVRFAENVDTKKLVALYVQLYPLFQQSYEELGYAGKYFNDRLMVVIDNLLAAPDVQEPVRLIQPKYYYLFADSTLESGSIGQRILMRIGHDNEAVIKSKLNEIKQELMLHMHEKQL